ncbi:MAG TPA: hypothetical protein VMV49_01365 [Candidatus Deferrimicrobium sp.]|nr:hypothetical protein [Candidatus Deferrimicrobium sp.]
MSKVIPLKTIKDFELIEDQLYSDAIISKNETVKEKFYPVKINNQIFTEFYGLLTESWLILALKKPLKKPKVFELIPYRSVKEVSLNLYRWWFLLLLILCGTSEICLGIFLFGFKITHILIIDIFLLILYFLIVILSIFLTFAAIRYIKGENTIILNILQRKLRIKYKYRINYGLTDITIIKKVETGQKNVGEAIKIEKLYEILMNYIKEAQLG